MDNLGNSARISKYLDLEKIRVLAHITLLSVLSTHLTFFFNQNIKMFRNDSKCKCKCNINIYTISITNTNLITELT